MDSGGEADALRLALSRTIVTKSNGASLASDVSHSRPHRTCMRNDYDVYEGFVQAARKIGAAVVANVAEIAEVNRGDARDVNRVPDGSVSMVVTSPPYLNAIDYLRGHRLALVWLGWSIERLRAIRGGSVGAERSANADRVHDLSRMLDGQFEVAHLPTRTRGMLLRYLDDLVGITQEVARVLEKQGQAVFVVGNSVLKGDFIDNSLLTAIAADLAGLHLVDRYERALPPNKRYLPPPSSPGEGRLTKRMRSEVVLRFAK